MGGGLELRASHYQTRANEIKHATQVSVTQMFSILLTSAEALSAPMAYDGYVSSNRKQSHSLEKRIEKMNTWAQAIIQQVRENNGNSFSF